MTKIDEFLKEWAPRKEIISKTTTAGKTCLLVVSSKSGFGNASLLTPKVADYLSESFSKVVVIPSQHYGHVRTIFEKEESLESYQVAVVLGGDGAFSEAVNGMLDRKDGARVLLSHCPGGSGCAIAGQTLGCWKGDDVKRACEIIGRKKTSKMDLVEIVCSDGKVRYSTSATTVGVGVDIIELGDKYRWTYYLFGPMFRYILGAFISFFKYYNDFQ